LEAFPYAKNPIHRTEITQILRKSVKVYKVSEKPLKFGECPTALTDVNATINNLDYTVNAILCSSRDRKRVTGL